MEDETTGDARMNAARDVVVSAYDFCKAHPNIAYLVFSVVVATIGSVILTWMGLDSHDIADLLRRATTIV